MKILICLLFLIVAFLPVPSTDGLPFRQGVGLIFLSLLISIQLMKKYSIIVGLCALVTFVEALFHCGQLEFGSEVMSSLMMLLFFTSVALSPENNYLELILPALSVVAIGDALLMTIKGLLAYGPQTYWFMNSWYVITNGSLDASFLAVMMPIKDLRTAWGKGICLLFCAAILISHSNTGLVTTGVVLTAYYISFYGKSALTYAVFGSSLLSLSGYFVFGGKFLQDSGRYRVWKIMMTWWERAANHWLGTGPGTFWVYGPQVQSMEVPHAFGDRIHYFPWMHNDWLQVLFEEGYVGLTSIVLLFITMLKKSFDRPVLFSMTLGYGIVAVTQFPLHLFFFQILGVALIYNVFVNKELVD